MAGYAGTYTIAPVLVSDSGSLAPGTPETHHVLEVEIVVTTPGDRAYTYRTLVARNP